MNHRNSTGGIICIVGFLYALEETAFFDHHFTPASAAECLCDGLALLMIVIGMALVAMGRRVP